MQRLFTKEPGLREDLYEKFAKDEQSRVAFIRRSRGLTGDDLKCMVETVITEKTTHRRGCTRKSHTEYLDSPELKKRFADKPDHLKRIREAGGIFKHPDTGAQMYALTTFTQDHSHCNLSLYIPFMPPCDPVLYTQSQSTQAMSIRSAMVNQQGEDNPPPTRRVCGLMRFRTSTATMSRSACMLAACPQT